DEVVWARCHLVGLASGIDWTTWSSADSGAARRSVSARTSRNAWIEVVRRSCPMSWASGVIGASADPPDAGAVRAIKALRHQSIFRRKRSRLDAGRIYPSPS